MTAAVCGTLTWNGPPTGPVNTAARFVVHGVLVTRTTGDCSSMNEVLVSFVLELLNAIIVFPPADVTPPGVKTGLGTNTVMSVWALSTPAPVIPAGVAG